MDTANRIIQSTSPDGFEVAVEFPDDKHYQMLHNIVARFDRNLLHLPTQSLKTRILLQSTLMKDFELLRFLSAVDKEGTEPTFTGIFDGQLMFDELAHKMPSSRRNANYNTASDYALAQGGNLITFQRFETIVNKEGILLEDFGDWTWVDTSDRPDLLEKGLAMSAFRNADGAFSKIRPISDQSERGSYRYTFKSPIS
jgi:hypothetical protein